MLLQYIEWQWIKFNLHQSAWFWMVEHQLVSIGRRIKETNKQQTLVPISFIAHFIT